MRHLYVHIPFCARRCSYCDFSIAVRKRIPARDYVEAVRRELELVRTADPGATPRGSPGSIWTQEAGPITRRGPGLEPDQQLTTIYLGGGTPSLLPPDAIAELLTSLRDAFHVTSLRDDVAVTPSDDVEVTLEANPDDVTPESATIWRRAGVNRVSLGAQSFDDRVLAWMHRTHDAAAIDAAVRHLRAARIENISLDLIFALPADLGRDWARDLDRAIALQPAHLSLYGLTVEQRTPLARWISRGAASAPDDERYAEEYLLAHARLTAGGYRFYEISNAARDDRRSRHNAAYWSGAAYLGLGPAAHSFDGRARRWNTPAWEAYRRALAAGRSPVESEELLTDEQRELERLYLALRTDAGLLVAAHCRPLPPLAAQWAARGWVELTGGRLRCTPEGWLRLDSLVHDLTDPVAMS
jgi:oxygen-independent coproporphyrinogen III oxidase